MELNKIKVLLVDDDDNFGFALKTLLNSKGLNIDSYTNPEEALEFLRQEKVDIILLDYYMPQMTGEQFLKKLREFDETTIVFLQTAFSEEKPELEMLETLNIQGYIDKNKNPNDIFLDIFTGIKMAGLVNVIKEKENQIHSLEYKDEFLGRFLGILMGEIKEKSFGIVGCIDAIGGYENQISEDKENFTRYVENIKKSIKDLNELIESLDLNKDIITTIELKTILEKLFYVMCLVKNVTLNIGVNNQMKTIENARIIIYILADIIKYLIDKEENNIDIQISSSDKNIITINNSIDNNELLNKICKLSEFDENIKINNNEKLSIEC